MENRTRRARGRQASKQKRCGDERHGRQWVIFFASQWKTGGAEARPAEQRQGLERAGCARSVTTDGANGTKSSAGTNRQTGRGHSAVLAGWRLLVSLCWTVIVGGNNNSDRCVGRVECEPVLVLGADDGVLGRIASESTDPSGTRRRRKKDDEAERHQSLDQRARGFRGAALVRSRHGRSSPGDVGALEPGALGLVCERTVTVE